MAKERYDFVLEDDLYLEYYKFMNQDKGLGDFNLDIVKKILSFYKRNILTNLAQLSRLEIKVDSSKKYQLKSAGFVNQTLEELANKTFYKIVLSSGKSNFPFVNINGDTVESNLSGTYFSNQNRDKAFAHIKQLCAYAQKSICVFDKYICNTNPLDLNNLLPNKGIDICFTDTIKGSKFVADLERFGAAYKIKYIDMLSNSHHDRYIIIDDTLEIILSGGLQHLVSNFKDFTYLIRNVERNHLLR